MEKTKDETMSSLSVGKFLWMRLGRNRRQKFRRILLKLIFANENTHSKIRLTHTCIYVN